MNAGKLIDSGPIMITVNKQRDQQAAGGRAVHDTAVERWQPYVDKYIASLKAGQHYLKARQPAVTAYAKRYGRPSAPTISRWLPVPNKK